MSKIARLAINNLNKTGKLNDAPTQNITKGFMGNKKPKEMDNDPTSRVAHYIKFLRNQRKELFNADS
jgi:hypothetical protein|tara:strand:+ start:459 stop:659 length:201 start_codon:yes stop_codon:yes gene_type:complete